MSVTVSFPPDQLSYTLEQLVLLRQEDDLEFDDKLLAVMHRDLVQAILKTDLRSPGTARRGVTMECEWEHVDVLRYIDRVFKEKLEAKQEAEKAQEGKKKPATTKKKAKAKKKGIKGI